jgi:cell division protein FtsQ
VKTAALALRSVPRGALALSPVWRRRLTLVLALLIALASAYWFWFRDSSFARVHDVYVTGVDGPQARQIRSALEQAGLDMTTLHVRADDLRSAVAEYPVVRSIAAEGSFPHKLTIDVDLNLPVAVLQTPSGSKPVAADGLLLSGVPMTNLPVLTTKAMLTEKRVTGGRAFDLVRVVALAPEPLRTRIKSVSFRAGVGLVAQVRSGPELRFGDTTRLPAKWMAAARVLAAAAARGASYIDVRLPERPAAGGLPTTSLIPLAPAGEAAAGAAATPAPAATTTLAPTTAATTPTAPASTPAGTPTAAPMNTQSQVQPSPQVSTQP